MIIAITTISLTTVMLIILLIWREITHDRERRDLLNRIMAKDYNDYARNIQGKSPPKVGGVLRQAVMERHPAYRIVKEGDDQ